MAQKIHSETERFMLELVQLPLLKMSEDVACTVTAMLPTGSVTVVLFFVIATHSYISEEMQVGLSHMVHAYAAYSVTLT